LINDFGLQEGIRLTGTVPIDDVRRLYAACDMVVVPSVVDLDPQVQIEAMASGKPVIGTRVGTMPRRIKDGMSGFIIDPADERQLADKIKYLLDNPSEREKMGACARQLVINEYSSDKMAVRMLEVFQNE
jgi:glycosyltransferase involved in cell wall biosynthesis